MKIYLILSLDTVEYDNYDAIVVFAKSKKSAIKIARQRCYNFTENVECVYLGIAGKNNEEGEILSSFNAG